MTTEAAYSCASTPMTATIADAAKGSKLMANSGRAQVNILSKRTTWATIYLLFCASLICNLILMECKSVGPNTDVKIQLSEDKHCVIINIYIYDFICS